MYTKTVLARKTSSISEFKKNPSAAMNESNGEPVAVLSHNKPAFYCLSPEMFEIIMDKLTDKYLLDKAVSRLDEEEIEVNLDEL